MQVQHPFRGCTLHNVGWHLRNGTSRPWTAGSFTGQQPLLFMNQEYKSFDESSPAESSGISLQHNGNNDPDGQAPPKPPDSTAFRPRVYTLAEAARILKVGPLTVRRRIWSGELEQVRGLHLIRISEEELSRFISGNHPRLPERIRRPIWRRRPRNEPGGRGHKP